MQIRLSRPQLEFAGAQDQFPAFVGGFGSGKTHAGIARALARKLQYPGQNVAYYLPTYGLIKDIAFPRFAEMLTLMGIPFQINRSDKDIKVATFGKIILRTMDSPEAIIGYEVADSVVDELDTLPMEKARDVWNKIIGRNRQKKPDGSLNTVAVATTPEGVRFVHWRWVANRTTGYRVIHAATESNRHLPEGYVQSLRDSYPPQLLAAYLDGRFVNLTSGSVYSSFNRDRCDSDAEIRAGEQLYIGQDFNVGAMCSAVAVKRVTGWHIVDELTGVLDTPELIKTINSRYPGHAIAVYPDASGSSRKTVDASKSDIALLQAAGFSVRAKPANPPVKDRIMAVNGAFERADLWVNARKCPTVASSLEQQAYDKNGEPDKGAGFDHMNDALGYLAVYEMPIRKPIAQMPIKFTY